MTNPNDELKGMPSEIWADDRSWHTPHRHLYGHAYTLTKYTRSDLAPTDSAMEDAFTREDEGLRSHSDRQVTSSTTAERALEDFKFSQSQGYPVNDETEAVIIAALQSTRKPPEDSYMRQFLERKNLLKEYTHWLAGGDMP